MDNFQHCNFNWRNYYCEFCLLFIIIMQRLQIGVRIAVAQQTASIISFHINFNNAAYNYQQILSVAYFLGYKLISMAGSCLCNRLRFRRKTSPSILGYLLNYVPYLSCTRCYVEQVLTSKVICV